MVLLVKRKIYVTSNKILNFELVKKLMLLLNQSIELIDQINICTVSSKITSWMNEFLDTSNQTKNKCSIFVSFLCNSNKCIFAKVNHDNQNFQKTFLWLDTELRHNIKRRLVLSLLKFPL